MPLVTKKNKSKPTGGLSGWNSSVNTKIHKFTKKKKTNDDDDSKSKIFHRPEYAIKRTPALCTAVVKWKSKLKGPSSVTDPSEEVINDGNKREEVTDGDVQVGSAGLSANAEIKRCSATDGENQDDIVNPQTTSKEEAPAKQRDGKDCTTAKKKPEKKHADTTTVAKSRNSNKDLLNPTKSLKQNGVIKENTVISMDQDQQEKSHSASAVTHRRPSYVHPRFLNLCVPDSGETTPQNAGMASGKDGEDQNNLSLLKVDGEVSRCSSARSSVMSVRDYGQTVAIVERAPDIPIHEPRAPEHRLIAAIPRLPLTVAVICMIFNILIPGTGMELVQLTPMNRPFDIVWFDLFN